MSRLDERELVRTGQGIQQARPVLCDAELSAVLQAGEGAALVALAAASVAKVATDLDDLSAYLLTLCGVAPSTLAGGLASPQMSGVRSRMIPAFSRPMLRRSGPR